MEDPQAKSPWNRSLLDLEPSRTQVTKFAASCRAPVAELVRSPEGAFVTTGCSAGPSERSCSGSEAAQDYYFATAG